MTTQNRTFPYAQSPQKLRCYAEAAIAAIAIAFCANGFITLTLSGPFSGQWLSSNFNSSGIESELGSR